MKITIVYATESGVSEMVAEDLADELREHHEVIVNDLADVLPQDLQLDSLHLIVCSTYGDGELPSAAEPFVQALRSERVPLHGLDYAMFGLGDSSYEDSYSRGSEILDTHLTEQGATRIGEYGRHDASTGSDPSAQASQWLCGVLEATAVSPRS